jgi:hypothetical protein
MAFREMVPKAKTVNTEMEAAVVEEMLERAAEAWVAPEVREA